MNKFCLRQKTKVVPEVTLLPKNKKVIKNLCIQKKNGFAFSHPAKMDLHITIILILIF